VRTGDRVSYGPLRGVAVAPAPGLRRWYFRSLAEDGTWVREIVSEIALRDVETPTWAPGAEVRVGVHLRAGVVAEVIQNGLRYRVRLRDGEEEVVGPELLDLDLGGSRP
jgi:hypothetical protein